MRSNDSDVIQDNNQRSEERVATEDVTMIDLAIHLIVGLSTRREPTTLVNPWTIANLGANSNTLVGMTIALKEMIVHGEGRSHAPKETTFIRDMRSTKEVETASSLTTSAKARRGTEEMNTIMEHGRYTEEVAIVRFTKLQVGTSHKNRTQRDTYRPPQEISGRGSRLARAKYSILPP